MSYLYSIIFCLDSLPKAYGAIVLTFKHNSSIPELSWREDASVIDKIATIGAGTAAAVCGICVYLPLKGVGELLTLSYWTVKEIFKNILETRGEIKSIEKSCIKIYFELKSKQDLKELIIDVEKRTLHKYLAIAIQMESSKFKVFHGVNVHINQDHFVVTIQTLKGTTVDLKNYRQLSHEIKTQV